MYFYNVLRMQNGTDSNFTMRAKRKIKVVKLRLTTPLL